MMAQILEDDFGVTDHALCWVNAFLDARRKRVTVDGRKSRDFDVTSGVPQDSCLGPILFLLYISRLFHVVKKHLPQVHGYADDTYFHLFIYLFVYLFRYFHLSRKHYNYILRDNCTFPFAGILYVTG